MSEPVAVRVTRYRCPYCRRSHANKSRARVHIDRCWHNPQVQACKTCAHHQPSGFDGYCVPGTICACGETPEECRAGVDISQGLVIDCPLWALREEVADDQLPH